MIRLFQLNVVFVTVFALSCAGSPQRVEKVTSASPVANQTSPTPTPFPNQAPVDQSKAKTFNGRGKVTKINLELVSVELDHEEIKGHMPKMIMEFYVKEKSELLQLRLGDTVDFVLEENAGQEKIISIKRAQ